MKIIIRLARSGATHTLEVEKSATIESIKEQLSALEGIPPEQQKLISNGHVLDDTATMESLGAQEGSVFRIVLYTKGG